MPFSAAVLYPNQDDLKFDMDYYLKTHMPLVQEHWARYGLTNWEIVSIGDTADGSKAPFSVQANLTWTNEEAFKTAVASVEAKTVFGDIPKFTNAQPIILAGSIVGSQS